VAHITQHTAHGTQLTACTPYILSTVGLTQTSRDSLSDSGDSDGDPGIGKDPGIVNSGKDHVIHGRHTRTGSDYLLLTDVLTTYALTYCLPACLLLLYIFVIILLLVYCWLLLATAGYCWLLLATAVVHIYYYCWLLLLYIFITTACLLLVYC
jgi:hypothetical protein